MKFLFFIPFQTLFLPFLEDYDRDLAKRMILYYFSKLTLFISVFSEELEH